MGVKPYVVFRDELIRDMQKNKQIFQNVEEITQVSINDNENNIRKSK